MTNVVPFKQRQPESEIIVLEEAVTGEEIEGVAEFEKLAGVVTASVVHAMKEDGMDIESLHVDLFVIRESIVAAMARGKGIQHPFQYVANNICELRF